MNMEHTGSITTLKLSKNEFLIKWYFSKKIDTSIDIPRNNFLSDLSGILISDEFSGLQMAMMYDDLQHVVKFILFLYGCEGRSASKITFSACLSRGDSPEYKINCSDVCLDLQKHVKILEIHSLSGIFHTPSKNSRDLRRINCSVMSFYIDYCLQLKMKLHKISNIPSCSNKNVSLQDLRENNGASSTTLNEDSKRLPNRKYPKQLVQDLKFLFTSGHMCDLEIRIGESILRAHKLILSARSSVFKRMMEHNCLESSSNSISITDCPVSPFEKFLKYLYTGELEDRTMDTVMPLYSLGDKYDVQDLRETCFNILKIKLSSESVYDVANIVCDVLQLSECHNDLKLKDLAASFIVSNFQAVSNKQSWKDLMKSDFELTSNILVLVLRKHRLDT